MTSCAVWLRCCATAPCERDSKPEGGRVPTGSWRRLLQPPKRPWHHAAKRLCTVQPAQTLRAAARACLRPLTLAEQCCAARSPRSNVSRACFFPRPLAEPWAFALLPPLLRTPLTRLKRGDWSAHAVSLRQHNQQNQAASATQPLLQRDGGNVLLTVMCKDILNACVKIFHVYDQKYIFWVCVCVCVSARVWRVS
jgi:hypothetical protein